MEIFLIIIIMLNGEIIETQEYPGPINATMEMCQKVADGYNIMEVPKGYEIQATCEDRRNKDI